MKAAWSDAPRVTFHGRFRTVEDLAIEPKPVQRPHPPIWFGGKAPRALARAVRHGDAFMAAGAASTQAFATAVQTIRAELAEQGKDPDRFRIGKRVYLIVDDDAAAAHARALAGLERIYGTTTGFEQAPVSGTPADVVRELRAVIDAGAQTILLHPVGGSLAEDREQMERLAAEIIPQLS